MSDHIDDIDYEKIAYQRRVKQQAAAIISRAKNAGIPDRYLRIGPEEFRDLLSIKHYGEEGLDSVVKFVYDKADVLARTPFILIDGANVTTRKKVGFALLFRLIACDMVGAYRDCCELSHKFQTIKSTESEYRNDATDMLKKYDALYISEFHTQSFAAWAEAGSFFDELLNHRVDALNPTIISFQDMISPHNQTDRSCGSYLANLAKTQFTVDNNPSNDILIVRAGE